MKRILLLGFFVLAIHLVFGQKAISFDDLSDFRSLPPNWKTVSWVALYPSLPPLEEFLETSPKSRKKKKRRKKKKADTSPLPSPTRYLMEEGNGILLATKEDSLSRNLITHWEHGDIELWGEIMLSPGAESGILLQGRYKIQLADSWGQARPGGQDMGALVGPEQAGAQALMAGKAPVSNPCKAPGLWQKFHLLFQAPDFDQEGRKIKNARLLFMDLNGVRIHQNVELLAPSRGAPDKSEKARGPLVIQSNTQALALRSWKYTLIREPMVSIEDVSYQGYEGKFLLVSDFRDLPPARTGSTDLIDTSVSGWEDNFGMKIQAKLKVDEEADYQLTLNHRGGVLMYLDGKKVFDYQRRDAWDGQEKTLSLEAGVYPLEIYYFKSAGWMPTGLGLDIQAKGTYAKSLNSPNSYSKTARMVSPIYVSPGKSARLLRGFLDFPGVYRQRLTHTIAVGTPRGIHFVFDTKTQSVACAWRGDFLDATPMWHNRGDGSFDVRGAALFTFWGQSLSVDSNGTPGFSRLYEADGLKARGYTLDEESGMPSFQFEYKGGQGSYAVAAMESRAFSQKISDSPQATTLHHAINYQNPDTSLLAYVKLAQGTDIRYLGHGYYSIGDQNYFIHLPQSPEKATIRNIGDTEELYAPIQDGTLFFEQIW